MLQKFKLAQLLSLERRKINVQAEKEYAEIGIYSFFRGIFHKSPRKGWEVGEKDLYLIKENDFIFQITFAWEGAVAIAQKQDNNLFGSVRFPTFRVNSDLCNARYLLWWFQTKKGKQRLFEVSPGSALRNRVLNIKKLLETEIILPSLGEQNKFALTLDTAESRKNELIVLLNEQCVPLVRRLHQIVLQKAISGKLVPQFEDEASTTNILSEIKYEKEQLLNERKVKITNKSENDDVKRLLFGIPEKWSWFRLGDIVFFQEGPGIRNWQFKNEGIKLLNVQNIISNGKLDFEKSDKYVSEVEFESKYRHFLIEKGDLLFAASGGSWGKSAWFKDPGYKVMLNTSTIRLRFYSEKFEPAYLKYFIDSDFFRKQLKVQLVGMQPNFGSTHLSRAYIPVPPIKEQKRIVEKMNEIMTLCRSLEIKMSENMNNAQLLTDVLLKEVFVSNKSTEESFVSQVFKNIKEN